MKKKQAPIKNKVRPTEKQIKTFENIKAGMKPFEAARLAGYSDQTVLDTRQNILNAPGFLTLVHEFREDLAKAGVTKEVIATIQAEGLKSRDPKVRLDYLKEAKKDLGLYAPAQPQDNGNLVRRYTAEEFFN